jgi:hypothetical protein
MQNHSDLPTKRGIRTRGRLRAMLKNRPQFSSNALCCRARNNPPSRTEVRRASQKNQRSVAAVACTTIPPAYCFTFGANEHAANGVTLNSFCRRTFDVGLSLVNSESDDATALYRRTNLRGPLGWLLCRGRDGTCRHEGRQRNRHEQAVCRHRNHGLLPLLSRRPLRLTF